MKQMILEISESAKFEDMPDELKEAIKRANITWPESMLIGTEAVNGKKLVLIMSSVDSETLLTWMNDSYPTGRYDENGDEITIAFNLDWQVVAEEGVPVDQSKLIPYFSPLPILDDKDGGIIGFEPITDLTDKIQVWAGKKWAY